jgi:hypothetical protein
MNNKTVWLLIITLYNLLIYVRSQVTTCSTPYLSATDCDPRCDGKCAKYFDQNYCCDCALEHAGVKHYFWILNSTNSYARCGPTCPTKYYPNTTTANYYTCSHCDALCQTCTTSGNTNCVTCISTAYSLGMTSCYQISNAQNAIDNQPYRANPCPPPYYGVYTTMKCQPCPTGCTKCAISLAF